MTYLDRILDYKRLEVGELRASRQLGEYRAQVADLPPARGFRAALARPGGPHLIAELKKASPSKGLIRPDYNPVAFARRYEASGASAISCLTDQRFFLGSNEDLKAVREVVQLPILRKDFTLDESQIYEARSIGADAILLIVAALEDRQLGDLLGVAGGLGLDALVEVHSEEELNRALGCASRPSLIGINNRNLSSFHTDLAVTERLAPKIPSETTVVGESGIVRRSDVDRLAAAGVHAILVGETLMRYADPGEGVHMLLEKDSSTKDSEVSAPAPQREGRG